MTELQLQNGVGYARRYILSACMNGSECKIIQAEASKLNAWKKAKTLRVRIDPKSWNVEIGLDTILEKNVFATAELKEVKDPDKEEPFLCIQMNQRRNEYISFTGDRSFIEIFKCGLGYLPHFQGSADDQEKLSEIDNNEFAQKKKAEFDVMVEKIKAFLGDAESHAPEVPPPPPNLNFAK